MQAGFAKNRKNPVSGRGRWKSHGKFLSCGQGIDDGRQHAAHVKQQMSQDGPTQTVFFAEPAANQSEQKGGAYNEQGGAPGTVYGHGAMHEPETEGRYPYRYGNMQQPAFCADNRLEPSAVIIFFCYGGKQENHKQQLRPGHLPGNGHRIEIKPPHDERGEHAQAQGREKQEGRGASLPGMERGKLTGRLTENKNPTQHGYRNHKRFEQKLAAKGVLRQQQPGSEGGQRKQEQGQGSAQPGINFLHGAWVQKWMGEPEGDGKGEKNAYRPI